MTHPNLKSTTDNLPIESDKQFARLLVPDVDIAGPSELYEAVAAHGSAVICPFKAWTWELLPPITLTPQEFERDWQID